MPFTMFYDRFPDIADKETRNLIVFNDPDVDKPHLNHLSPQSQLAPALLKKVKEVVLRDESYIERLKGHYRLFRKTVEGKSDMAIGNMTSKKIGRNDPCPCGSGKKYKHCCLDKQHDS